MSGRQLTKDDDNETNFHPSCRICFASNQTLMIPSPCNCSGSLGFVHKNCLQRWAISVRNFSSCEICHGKYEKVGVLPKRYSELKQRKKRQKFKFLSSFDDICHFICRSFKNFHEIIQGIFLSTFSRTLQIRWEFHPYRGSWLHFKS